VSGLINRARNQSRKRGYQAGGMMMKRPTFTVVRKNGIREDANHLRVAVLKGVSVLSYLCSGAEVCIPASEVESVTFYQEGAEWCSECDQSIAHIQYKG
jgi:hypothetical protein